MRREPVMIKAGRFLLSFPGDAASQGIQLV